MVAFRNLLPYIWPFYAVSSAPSFALLPHASNCKELSRNHNIAVTKCTVLNHDDHISSSSSTTTTKEVVIKHATKYSKESEQLLLNREIQFYLELKRRLHSIGISPESTNIVMPLNLSAFAAEILFPYFPHGDLETVLYTRSYFDVEYQMAIIARDVLIALSILHNSAVNLPHNDIKTDNILVSELSNDDRNVIEHVKLIDFGLGGTNHFYCGFQYGTREHVSPEMLKQHVTGKCPENPLEVAKATDIWALGVVLYRFCYHRDPFKISGPRRRGYPTWYYKQYVLRYNQVAYTIRKQSMLFENGKDFLLKLLAWQPGDRLTAAEALEHPFLKQLPLKERKQAYLDYEIIEDHFTTDNS